MFAMTKKSVSMILGVALLRQLPCSQRRYLPARHPLRTTKLLRRAAIVGTVDKPRAVSSRNVAGHAGAQ